MSPRPPSLAELFKQNNTPNLPTQTATPVPEPKIGEQILENDPAAPRDFTGFTGQSTATQMLNAVVQDAQTRNRPPEHILLSSGLPGIGKSALSRLTAFQLNLPYIETQGKVSLKEAIALCSKLQSASSPNHPGAILFLDEIHQVFSGRKEDGEWLLSLMQDRVILTSEGEKKFPDITIIGATTDGQTIPDAALSRFTWAPPLQEYSEDEAVQIASQYAPHLSTHTLERVARAAACNPRTIKKILNNIRVAQSADLVPQDPDMQELDLTIPLRWSQVDENGLTLTARRIYAILFNKRAWGERGYGMNNIAAELGEPLYPLRDEALLKRLGLLTVSSNGRSLTEFGVEFRHNISLEG